MIMYDYVCMYGCMHACMYACMDACMHACMHVCMHACIHVCMCVCMDACMHVCMYGCMHACMYVCMDACMHACMHHFCQFLPGFVTRTRFVSLRCGGTWEKIKGHSERSYLMAWDTEPDQLHVPPHFVF